MTTDELNTLTQDNTRSGLSGAGQTILDAPSSRLFDYMTEIISIAARIDIERSPRGSFMVISRGGGVFPLC